jgi:hypothetical protein
MKKSRGWGKKETNTSMPFLQAGEIAGDAARGVGRMLYHPTGTGARATMPIEAAI